MMPNDKPLDTAKAAWQSQPVEATDMPFLRIRALEHSRYGRNRHALEYLSAIAGVFFGVWFIVATESTLLRVGLGALIAGGLYWVYHFRQRKLAWGEAGSNADALDGLSFYKRELMRLRDMHRELCRTHLVATIPGALTLSAWVLLDHPTLRSEQWWHTALIPLAVAAWIGSMIWHEIDKANGYQRELDALEPTAE